MIQLTAEQEVQVHDARVLSYILRQRLDLTTEQVLEKVRQRFGDHPSWTAERVEELLNLRKASRAPKPPHANTLKAEDAEVKAFIRSFAASGEQGKAVREAVTSRFGSARTPSLTTVLDTMKRERRAAGLPPVRGRYGSRVSQHTSK